MDKAIIKALYTRSTGILSDPTRGCEVHAVCLLYVEEICIGSVITACTFGRVLMRKNIVIPVQA